MDFNEKLLSLRRVKGFSQEQLADLINVSRQAISKWETAESQPDLTKLILLSNVFEVSLDELCGRTPETAAVMPIAPNKIQSRFAWPFTGALIIALIIGLTGGFFASRAFSPTANRQEIKSVSITSFYLNPELYNQKMRLVFCPSITAIPGNNDVPYSCSVLKIDADGKASSYPAVFTDGVCTSDVSVDFSHRDFTLHAVFRIGAFDYTIGLVKITSLAESSYGFEELWNK